MKGLIMPFILIGGVLGSIYVGVATVTESAAIGATAAVLIAWGHRELTIQGMRKAL